MRVRSYRVNWLRHCHSERVEEPLNIDKGRYVEFAQNDTWYAKGPYFRGYERRLKRSVCRVWQRVAVPASKRRSRPRSQWNFYRPGNCAGRLSRQHDRGTDDACAGFVICSGGLYPNTFGVQTVDFGNAQSAK
jgi:hypothetical protein